MKKIALALGAFALFVLLGWSVTRYGEPPALIAWGVALQNHASLFAWWLTWSCYLTVLGPLGICLLLVAWRAPAWRSRILFSLVVMLLCWQCADLAQHAFMRPRRLDWVVKRETAFSYPSSHAAISTGFYALWAGMLYWSQLPRGIRIAGSALLATLSLAICWSRLGLGAHYVTDLIGGALLAVAIVAAALAALPIRIFTRRTVV